MKGDLADTEVTTLSPSLGFFRLVLDLPVDEEEPQGSKAGQAGAVKGDKYEEEFPAEAGIPWGEGGLY